MASEKLQLDEINANLAKSKRQDLDKLRLHTQSELNILLEENLASKEAYDVGSSALQLLSNTLEKQVEESCTSTVLVDAKKLSRVIMETTKLYGDLVTEAFAKITVQTEKQTRESINDFRLQINDLTSVFTAFMAKLTLVLDYTVELGNITKIISLYAPDMQQTIQLLNKRLG